MQAANANDVSCPPAVDGLLFDAKLMEISLFGHFLLVAARSAVEI